MKCFNWTAGVGRGPSNNRSPSGFSILKDSLFTTVLRFLSEMEMGQLVMVMGQMGHHFWMGNVGHGSQPVTH